MEIFQEILLFNEVAQSEGHQFVTVIYEAMSWGQMATDD